MRYVVAIAALFLGSAGCTADQVISLNWSLGARTCEAAGVASVSVTSSDGSVNCDDPSDCNVSCLLGNGDANLPVYVGSGTTEITVTGLSASGQALYRGTAPVDQSTAALSVTLDWIGG